MDIGASTPSSSSENKPREEDNDSHSKIPLDEVIEEPAIGKQLTIEEKQKI